jgi:hypothetical protein
MNYACFGWSLSRPEQKNFTRSNNLDKTSCKSKIIL